MANIHSSESSYDRSYFYVGGEYVDNGDGQHVMKGQMYVEQLVPINGVKHPWPLVFIHGAGQTGTVSSSLAIISAIPWYRSYDFPIDSKKDGMFKEPE